MKKLAPNHRQRQKALENEHPLVATVHDIIPQENIRPENKLILQPAIKGANKGSIRVFIESPSGQRDDWGFLNREQTIQLLARFLHIQMGGS